MKRWRSQARPQSAPPPHRVRARPVRDVQRRTRTGRGHRRLRRAAGLDRRGRPGRAPAHGRGDPPRAAGTADHPPDARLPRESLMTRPRKVKIRWPDGSTREATVGPDVDLETEIVLDSRGRRIDDAYVEGAVADALAKVGRGRP